jgi:uncharacterized protein (DUF1800 family)
MRAYLLQAGFAFAYAAATLSAAPASAEPADESNGIVVVRNDAPAIVPVTAGEPLRITASGSIAYDLPAPACASVDPRGCRDADAERDRPLADAPAGALIATFRDARGVPLAQTFAPGDAAIVPVPAGAHDVALSVNLNSSDAATGEFTVAALPVALHPVRTSGTPAVLTPRMKTQHILRRFGFSTTPSQITQITAEGVDKWFAQQLKPNTIDDSVALAHMEPLPTRTNSTGGIIDWNVWERRLLEREVYTQRMVQEKMVLHWLDHFSVGNEKVGDPAVMGAYEDVLRANALGNFATLASSVSRTAAMLYWLDNNYNNGNDPIQNPPNENFARELMQLFTMGPYKLNMDGSQVLNSAGVPIPSFTESDVKEVAQGFSGFYVDYDYGKATNPNTRFRTMFTPQMHTPGYKLILGKFIYDPDTAACSNLMMVPLVNNPSSAPFLAKELLQRLADENPSPRFIAEVANVWQKNVNAPNQIALVLQTIEQDPEFYQTDYHSMPKEPVELFIQMARDMPIVFKEAHYQGGGSNPPASSLLYYLNQTEQEPYDPPSVFSFYYPGHKEQLISQATLFGRFDNVGDMISEQSTYGWADTALNIPELRARIGSTAPTAVASYLLDAFVDNDSPQLANALRIYLGGAPVDDEKLEGAMWILTTSPEFEVN